MVAGLDGARGSMIKKKTTPKTQSQAAWGPTEKGDPNPPTVPTVPCVGANVNHSMGWLGTFDHPQVLALLLVPCLAAITGEILSDDLL